MHYIGKYCICTFLFSVYDMFYFVTFTILHDFVLGDDSSSFTV